MVFKLYLITHMLQRGMTNWLKLMGSQVTLWVIGWAIRILHLIMPVSLIVGVFHFIQLKRV